MDVEKQREAERNDRVDFVKRLFAVAISVGFATQVSRIIQEQQTSHRALLSVASDHRVGLILLLASLFIVVGSWEGYLASIRGKPLDDTIRFYIDIAIVFEYLLLMLCSELPQEWFAIHFLIFGTYLIWDIFARRYVKAHSESPEALSLPHPQLRQESIVITAAWAYCSLLLWISYSTKTNGGTFIAAIIAVLILFGYRQQKRVRKTTPWPLWADVVAIILVFGFLWGSHYI